MEKEMKFAICNGIKKIKESLFPRYIPIIKTNQFER